MSPKSKLQLFALCILGLVAGPGQAETTQCTEITFLPIVINPSGVYCLKKDLKYNNTTGAAITVNGNNVTIDFNGFKLGGLGAGFQSEASGILGNGILNLTIRNGNIRGFYKGVNLTGSGNGHLIEDSIFDRSIRSAVYVEGTGITIRNNRIVNSFNHNNYVYAIHVRFADGVRVLDNEIDGISGDDSGWVNVGIYVNGTNNAVISGNRITGMTDTPDYTNYGIYSDGSGTLIDGNYVGNPAGLKGDLGVQANSGLCRNNVVQNYIDAQSSCVDAGGNYFVDAP